MQQGGHPEVNMQQGGTARYISREGQHGTSAGERRDVNTAEGRGTLTPLREKRDSSVYQVGRKKGRQCVPGG